EGRLAVCYGPLVLAADAALVGDDAPSLSAVGVSGAKLDALDIAPQSAPEKLKTWPGAKVFRINAVVRQPSGEAKPTQIRLVPFADAGAGGTPYKIWLPYAQPPPDRNLLIDGLEIRSRKPNMGSIIDGDLKTIATTFNNKRAPEDWFGVELEEPITIQ